MFTTKKDVDKHVRTGLAKLRTENEKYLRGYSIAKMYFKIGEYESALHYVSGYLSLKDDSPQAYKLQGNSYEKLKRHEKALASYQRSLQLNPKQPDLLIDVCKLILSDELALTPGKIRFWCEMVDTQHVQHEAALNLKMRLLRRDNADPQQMDEMLQREIAQQPNNVTLRVQMVKHMMDHDRLTDAFKYVFDLETKHCDILSQSLDWYNAVAQVVAKLHQDNLTANWIYWLLALKTVDKQLELMLAADKSYPQMANLTECGNLLFQFDQTLERAAKTVMTVCPERELANQCMRHYGGQLCLHAAALIFKRENLQKTHWREIMKSTLPLLLLAYNCGRTPTDEPWSRNTNEATKQLLSRWRLESAFRCAQAGRTLLSCIEDAKDNNVMANIRKICIEKGNWTSKEELIAQIRQYCSDGDWRRNVHRILFTNSDQIAKQSTSYLTQCQSLAEPNYELPRICDLEAYEECAQRLHPSSLSHMIYLSAGASDIADVKCSVFNELNLSVTNLASCGAETLNQLDVDSFLYAATIQAKGKLDQERSVYESLNKGLYVTKPKMLPFANVSAALATDEQANWWTAAYRVFKNISVDNLTEIRAILQYGIEAVRGVGSPKADLLVYLKLGQVFVARAQATNRSTERVFYEARAQALFKFSLHMMKMQHNRSLEQFRRFFKLTSNNSLDTEREINELAEEAVTFLASRYFKQEEYQECIDELTNIQLPFATYFQAEAYRKLENASNTPKKNKRVYIEKAKDCLQQTLALLEYPHVDKNHALKSIVHEDIKHVQQQLSSVLDANNSFTNGGGGIVNPQWSDDLNDSMASNRNRRSDSQQRPQHNVTELTMLMNKMMEVLAIVQEDVNSVRTKVNNIEEQLNKKQDTSSVDAAGVLDDYFIMDEELHNPNYNASYQQQQQQRMYTQNQMMPLPMNPPALNSFMASNSFYNNAYQMGINGFNIPYYAQQPPPPSQQAHQQIRNNPVMPPYADPNGMMGYALPPQQIVPMATDSRNIVNLLEQSSQPKPPPQQQHQPPPPIIQPMATVSPPMSTLTPSIHSTSFQNTPNLLLKTWNSSHNNAPVEKSPPVNVVITSSDPLPPHTTVTQQPTLSVTIPSHHIKNNIVAAAEPASSFTKTQAGHTTKAKSTDTMGGLTFSSTPVTAQATADTASLVDAAHGSTKPNPFASFSFGTSDKPAATMFGVTSAKPFGSQTTEPFGTASPFGGLPKPNTDSPFGWTSTPQPKDGKNTSISLFGGTLSGPAYGKTPETAKPTAAVVSAPPATTANTDDDYVPTAYFEPVIPLPDLVETKTGEEDEHIRFEHRAKLLRYVKETKEWKERGIGNMKVLVNKNDANKVRLLMRREQVYKLCCNQLLTKDAKFTALSQSGTALTWCGQDYSDNELQVELLAIRFKTADVCKQFHDAILEAQQNMSADTPSTVDPPKSTTIDAKATGFGAKFKPATGAWDCSACYLSNKPGDVKCMACNTAATESTSRTAVPATVSGFGNMFKPKTGSWECKACYITNKSDAIYCVACESPKDDTVPKKSAAPVLAATTTMKFSFGVPMATTTTPAVSAVPSSSGSFSFGTFTAMTTTTAGNLFGAMPPPPSTTSTAAKSALPFTLNGGSFSFGGDKKATLPPVEVASDASASTKIDSSSNASVALAPKESFSFVFKPKSPGGAAKPKGAQSVAATEDISDDENIEEENNTYFTPAIPLPDKVDVKTGEEDEHVVYSHRCKLFRFADGEWKERGLGDVKILKHKQSGNLRVVMRREQILKICLNHALTTEIVYNRKDDKTWHFSAMDYSEGEVEVLQFCLRFKTPEIATAFKAAIDKALTAKCSVQTEVTPPTAVTTTAGDDTAPSNISEEDLQKSKKLLLPIDFFTYNQATPCSGCRGCHSDDFKFPKLKDINLDIVDDNPLPMTMSFKQKPRNIDIILKQSSLSFSNGAANKVSDTQTNAFTNVSTNHGMFNQMVFGSPAAITPSIFGNSPATTTSTPTSVFGIGSPATFPRAPDAVAPIKKPENTDSIAPASAAATSFSFALDKSAPKGFSFGSTIFGGSPAAAAAAATTTTASTTITTPNLFGIKPNETVVTPSKSVLAEPIIKAETNTSPASGGLFGSTQPLVGTFSAPPEITETTTIFGGMPTFGKKENSVSVLGGDAFGSATTLSKYSFANQSADEPTEEAAGGCLDLPFKDTGISFATLATAPPANLDFANLAKQSTDLKTFSAMSSPSSSQAFIGLSKQNDFNSFKTSANQNTSGDGTGGADDATYDPHYDPIIELPDEIEVRTGEEEEDKVFGERAKLYRFDNDEHAWKERGVGELKILHHPIKNTYRLLMRREQVFKCVLNHSLSTEYVIKPLKQSDRAFCWSTKNYADDPIGVLEQLSVRFKKSEIAQRFETAVNKCISQLKLEPQED